ncbi:MULTISPECIES: DUF6891 domain-containing protein [Actinomadura]|uniref:DUF6891 domain-containing protein n=1 Tax=Actinomadura TaxID=1988 RepID=UPI000402D6F7|nr:MULTISPECIES: hypothetical protein [Actinomadura]RSN68161.1 hypothetical protein DMH08_11435 [Actinomadura sp. WAC 06369]
MSHEPVATSPHHHVRFLTALGRHDFESVVRQCTGLLGDDARGAVADAFAAHLADQATWPDDLDTDRLQRAFRELDTSGIVARLDHACCQNCGLAELGGEVAAGDEPRGYVFAHRQDMEAAVDDGILTLAYGFFHEDTQPPEAQAAIGEDVAAALRRHGLSVDWNGDPRRRIDVRLTWRRRRYTRLAAYPGSPPPTGGPVTVSYENGPSGGGQSEDLPVTPAEARDLLLTLTPYKGNFINFITPTKSLIATYDPGPRLKFEIPDPANRCYHSRHVTIEEAEQIVTVLATEDRQTLTDNLTTEPWA